MKREKEEKKQSELEAEEQTKQRQLQEEVRKKELNVALIQVYHTFCDSNLQTYTDEDFLAFVEQIMEIAADIKVAPRSEQLVVMFLLLTSAKSRSLIQLVTSFGKSCMFGLIASYLNLIKGKKVVVIVPN